MILEAVPNIMGKAEYLSSPYVTAGDRVYMVGHQDGTFPELGWHIKGEMGGIWNHPIKLMDGFDVELLFNGESSLKLDSATTFINYPFGNKHLYRLPNQTLEIERLQFVPDEMQGISIQYTFKNTGDTKRQFDFQFTGHSDLRPTWLGELTQMIDGEDKPEFLEENGQWLVKDVLNPWFVTYGANKISDEHSITGTTYKGLGTSNTLIYSLELAADEIKTLTFVIAGSYTSKQDALRTYNEIQANSLDYLSSKKQRYVQLANQSKLTIPDKKLEQAFEWLKYNCDWLVRTVPEIGTGITAGIPDYPWWFGVDSEYALKGYMAVGQTDAVYSTINLLDSVSNAVNGNGKIIHEMSTNGHVFNPGNINETPQFASLIWEVYRWNGDKEFLKKYFPSIKKGLEWLLQENDANDNLFPDGFGMMEIHGLNSEMIDVASYTQRAFLDAHNIAMELGNDSLATSYKNTAAVLKKKINESFWSSEFNSYADFLGTNEQAVHLIDDAIIRADTLNKPWAVAELEETRKNIKSNPSKALQEFVVHHNWVVNTPMEMQIADSAKAIKALNTAEKFVNPFGVFVTGIDRDDSAGSDDGSFKGSKVFSYTGAVMTLPTGVQAIAENNYGRPDNALNYLKRITRTFSYALPGSIYEVSPDYGMITQAWNIYSYAIPIVQQFFGINPMASEKKVIIKPQMPSEWKKASLENVIIANNEVSIYYEKTETQLTLKVDQLNPEWTIDIVLPHIVGVQYTTLEGYNNTDLSKDEVTFSTSEKSILLKIHLK
jgi:glycogen debranching enzyme